MRLEIGLYNRKKNWVEYYLGSGSTYHLHADCLATHKSNFATLQVLIFPYQCSHLLKMGCQSWHKTTPKNELRVALLCSWIKTESALWDTPELTDSNKINLGYSFFLNWLYSFYLYRCEVWKSWTGKIFKIYNTTMAHTSTGVRGWDYTLLWPGICCPEHWWIDQANGHMWERWDVATRIYGLLGWGLVIKGL